MIVYGKTVPFEILNGAQITSVEVKGEGSRREQVIFKTVAGRVYRMYHMQDCCESVLLEDVDGILNDLVGQVILLAEERRVARAALDDYDESWTWTFYTLRTNKVSITMRWYGTSNGYYSETVNFEDITDVDS